MKKLSFCAAAAVALILLVAANRSSENNYGLKTGTAGVPFTNLPTVNVLQMDKLDEGQVIVLQRRANGDLDLWTARADRWI